IGDVFVNATDGLTLYTFANDRDDADGDGAGDSDCNGGCADTWPPLLADAQSAATGAFSVVTRDDGSTLQWAFNGQPLYTFSGDSAQGDVNGEGVGDVWYVARPFPWVLADVDATAAGTVFVGRASVRGVDANGAQAADRIDRDGFTLYTFENDRNDTDGDGADDSDCNGGCAVTWPPLFADAGATPRGPFTLIERDDDTRQWALNGLPLYFFAPDPAPGATDGEGAGGVWYVARPTPVAPVDSDLGTLFAGIASNIDVDGAGLRSLDRAQRDGFTLYVFDNDAADIDGDGAGDSDCNGNCAVAWPPLFADAGASPTGQFSLVTREDGSRQWAFDGEPLYYFANDLVAGDVNGDQIGGVWHIARPAPVQLVSDGAGGDIFEARGLVAEVDANGDRADSESDRSGFTLYRFDDDRNDAEGDGAGDSDCNGGCAVTWPPLYAEPLDSPTGDFAIIDRSDGSRQWTYKGDPLYFFSGDGSPDDVNGVYGTWFTVNP
ncbi:MAG: hypothetical protein AAGA61_08230, partial [Pseudomonadota bacterium]